MFFIFSLDFDDVTVNHVEQKHIIFVVCEKLLFESLIYVSVHIFSF